MINDVMGDDDYGDEYGDYGDENNTQFRREGEANYDFM